MRFLLAAIFVCSFLSAAAVAAGRFDEEIARFEASDRENPPPPQGTLFIGSSSVRLWPQVSTTYSACAGFNRGFGGSEVDDIEFYYDRILAPYQPAQIVLYSGDNDLAAGKDPVQVFESFRDLISRIKDDFPAVHTYVISVKVSPARVNLEEEVRNLNNRLELWAQTNQNVTYIETTAPMMDGDTPRSEFFASDGLHLSPSGYRLWEEKLSAALPCQQ